MSVQILQPTLCPWLPRIGARCWFDGSRGWSEEWSIKGQLLMWCKPVESLELGCFTPAKDMPKEGRITAQFLKSQVIYSFSFAFP